MNNFYYLKKLPLERLIAVEIDNQRILFPKIFLSTKNIYINDKVIELDKIQSIYEDSNFVVLYPFCKMEFRSSRQRLHFCRRDLTPKEWVDKLLKQCYNVDLCLKQLQFLPIDDCMKKEIEDLLNEIKV